MQIDPRKQKAVDMLSLQLDLAIGVVKVNEHKEQTRNPKKWAYKSVLAQFSSLLNRKRKELKQNSGEGEK
ncbi:hypothetical protein KQX54_007727 [Cotesia glomerata]|uniref:Uncharacterized protein n=1 Tax=Cotesia glomerata TaxID=32391 RepID=A0AAV7HZ64_COTGL|nr:hypothetical protein KQX54_007727 [Cotesia glomerata]